MRRATSTSRIIRGLLWRVILFALALAMLTPEGLHLIRPVTEMLAKALSGLTRLLYDL